MMKAQEDSDQKFIREETRAGAASPCTTNKTKSRCSTNQSFLWLPCETLRLYAGTSAAY